MPLYYLIRDCKKRKWPSLQSLTLLLRGLTCVGICYGGEYGDYQFLGLVCVHVMFGVIIAARFRRY